MENKLLATGLEYELTECAIVKFIIPPLELPDGSMIKLRDARAVFPPIRMLVNNPDGTQIQALFDVTKGTWEIIKDGK